jgi:multiple sugar transport system permease protein
MMVPGQLTMIPVFLLLKKLGLVEQLHGPDRSRLRQRFRDLSDPPVHDVDPQRPDRIGADRRMFGISDLLERGASPLSAGLATLGIFTFMGSWNDFLWPLIVMVREEGYTLPVALANLNGQHPTDFGLLMAAAVMVVLPVIAVFIAAQKYVIQGIATTGLKE